MTVVRTHATIRPMMPGDVDSAAEMIWRNDWGERGRFFAWALDQPGITCFVADDAGSIVGTGVASAHGRVGWVGTIFVEPANRGGGLGRALTRTVIAELERRACRTLILIATPMGRPIYEREGFTVLDRQRRFTIDGLPPGEPDPRVRSYRGGDLDAILALDRAVTGEDRSAVLMALVNPGGTSVAISADGDLRGFLVRAPWRGGALIAPDPADALRLLDTRRRLTGPSHPSGAGVMASNRIGRERLRAAGWVESDGGVRMIRGEPLVWQPAAIWGQLNGALG
jgi:GNAT superfamily N-acetyltransferase